MDPLRRIRIYSQCFQSNPDPSPVPWEIGTVGSAYFHPDLLSQGFCCNPDPFIDGSEVYITSYKDLQNRP